MIAWWLILIVLGLNGVGLIASLWFIYHYCHSDDLKYNQGIFAQVVAILGFQIFYLAFTLVCYDSYNHVFGGGFDMSYFWKLIYLSIIMYLTVVLPGAVFYYQADSDPRIAKRSPLIQTSKSMGICIISCWGLIGILYVTSRKITIPVEDCDSFECPMHQVTVDFLSFLIGLPGYFGWFVLMIVGGVGTAAVPISLFYAWLFRPTPLLAAEYDDMKKVLGERATALRAVGESLKKREREHGASKGFSVKIPTHGLKFRQRVSRYKEVVSLLTEEYQRLERRRASLVRSPLKTTMYFIAAVASLTCSLALMLQVLLTVIIPHVAKVDPISGIGALMTILQRSRLMLPEFAIYLTIYGHEVCCAVYGLIKLNAKMKGCLPVEPLRPHQTHLNAILFHVAVMMLTGCAVIVLSITSLPSFVKGTEAETITEIQKRYMKVHKAMYRNSVFEWVWLMVLFVSAVWFAIWPSTDPPLDINDPKVMAKWAKLNAKLGIDPNAPGGLAPIEETPEPTEPVEPSAFDRFKNKLNKIDQGVTDAPSAFMGAAIKKPWQ